METRYYSGLDLGQMQDYSALAVIERTEHQDPNNAKKTQYHFAVRHLHRWPLGTAYPAIVTDVRKLFGTDPLKHSTLAVDQTGVGRAVVDLFRSAGITASLWPITITHGESGHGSTVAKKNLVGAVQVPLQDRRLKIAESLPLAAVLAEELSLFRVKVTLAANETYEAWRERDHDDLVLALTLALYVGSFPPVRWAIL
jgi:hypothetical protein